MPVFYLSDLIAFPNPSFADPDGLLAVGGDLSEERLLLAYSMGIFPWYEEPSPILWWSPNPRLIIKPSEIVISRSLKSLIRKGLFTVTFDNAFEEVINRCALIYRTGGKGTWITPDMIKAYIKLHKNGYAHSVETWIEGRLAGGLYGVSLGASFFGESMFSEVSNASKIALVALSKILTDWGFLFIDCQVITRHLLSLGAKPINRTDFLDMLSNALRHPTKKGSWVHYNLNYYLQIADRNL